MKTIWVNYNKFEILTYKNMNVNTIQLDFTNNPKNAYYTIILNDMINNKLFSMITSLYYTEIYTDDIPYVEYTNPISVKIHHFDEKELDSLLRMHKHLYYDYEDQINNINGIVYRYVINFHEVKMLEFDPNDEIELKKHMLMRI